MSGLRAIAIVMLTARIVSADCEVLRSQEAARAHAWNVDWGLIFFGVTVVQAAGALTPVGDKQRDTLIVGAAKSGIGALSHAILPIKIDKLGECRRALAAAGKLERNLFFLNHLGGLAVNIGGAVVLGHLHSWKDGLLSFAIGWPVGLLHAYTLPRGAWHYVRSVTATPTDGGAMVSIGGAF